MSALALAFVLLGVCIAAAAFHGYLWEIEHSVIPLVGDGSLAGFGADSKLSLLQDPASIVFVIAFAFTSVFTGEQIRSMELVLAFLVRNGSVERVTSIDELNRATTRANLRFELFGSRWVSLCLAVIAAIAALGVFAMATREGLLELWEPFASDGASQQQLFDQWWAGQRFGTLAILLVGFVGNYYILKQQALGFVFALWSMEAFKLGARVSARLEMNTDGYWGLRDLRNLMIWTYVSTIFHWVAFLGMSFFWLPGGRFGFTAAAFLAAAGFSVVVLPTVIVAYSCDWSKRRFVEEQIEADAPSMISSSRLDAKAHHDTAWLWQIPNLPFRVREGLIAVLIYLAAPLLVLLFASFFGGR